MDENLGMKKFETASSNDLNTVCEILNMELQQRTHSPSQTPSLDFKSLMREGSRFGLIDDPESWFEYRRMRNITSHTYDEATAEKVAGSAKSFLKDAKSLLEALEKG